MSLKIGDWKTNVYGIETVLQITSVDANTGQVTGNFGVDFVGLWDETSRTLTFGIAPEGGGGPTVYKGFLFSTPPNPAPGQDVVWTLAGFVQVTNLAAANPLGGNSRRSVFGWFAQITEVA